MGYGGAAHVIQAIPRGGIQARRANDSEGCRGGFLTRPAPLRLSPEYRDDATVPGHRVSFVSLTSLEQGRLETCPYVSTHQDFAPSFVRTNGRASLL